MHCFRVLLDFLIGDMQVFVVTFVDEPETAAFFFAPTDWSEFQNIDTDACIGWTVYNSTASRPCPSFGGLPCLVHRGFQTAFDSVRDDLIPAWSRMNGLDSSTKPKK